MPAQQGDGQNPARTDHPTNLLLKGVRRVSRPSSGLGVPRLSLMTHQLRSRRPVATGKYLRHHRAGGIKTALRPWFSTTITTT